jgi:hypothetical protein
MVASGAACGTVDLGDNPEPPDIEVDEDYFHCEIQPKVLTEFRCATGAAGDGGGCHTERSALKLVEVPAAARCRDGRVIGAAPDESLTNLERVRITIGVDADSSPFYRRPVGLDSHPRQIFDESSEAAVSIRRWLDQGAP